MEPSSREARWSVCPAWQYESLDHRTGELRPTFAPRCRRNDCPSCGPWKARIIELTLHVAQPELLVTIGPIQVEPHEISTQVSRYRQRVRRATSSPVQDAYFVESYTSRSEPHLHMYSFGAALRQDMVVSAAMATRLGDETHIDVQPITHHGNLGYGMKMITRPKSETDRSEFLRLNGGRLVHASRGFWRGPDGVVQEGGYLTSYRRVWGYQDDAGTEADRWYGFPSR